MNELTVKRGGDALRGGDCAADRETGAPSKLPQVEKVEVNPVTGNQYIFTPRPTLRTERRLTFPVDGLKAFEGTLSLQFEWIRPEAIDEADARDAQCRAGWSDIEYAHGFAGFEAHKVGEVWKATWSCWKSCE